MERKKKILIADDDTFLLDMYVFKFNQHNFEVHTALDGLQVIEKLKEGLDPDVILMDILMPNMDGFEMLEKIRSEGLGERSLKIVLTNRNQQSDFDHGRELGVAGYIVKANSTPQEVIDRVLEIISDHEKKERQASA